MVAEARPLTASDLPPDRPGHQEPFSEFIARHYGPHPGQRRFCEDAARYRAAIAGIGGGKTEVGAFEVVRHAIRYPGIKQLVVAPTFRMLNRSTRLVLKKVIGWWGDTLVAVEKKSENRIIFPGLVDRTGSCSEVYFGHAQDADSLRGAEVGSFWIDEAALCREDVWLVCQGRIRQPGMPHRGWITGTPKGQNWVYRTFVEGRENWSPERRARYGFHHWPTHDNPLYKIEPDFLEALEESYGIGTDFYRQEMLALFVALAGLVYKEFNASKHVVSTVPDMIVRVLAGVDWGVTSPGCIIVIGITAEGVVFVLDEVYERGVTISGTPGNDWLSTAEALREKWKIERFFCDPEDANAILTFQRAGLLAVQADNKRIPGVRAVQALIAGDKFRVLGNAAPNLLTELSEYHWREDKDGNPIEDQDPAKEFDHALDALRYVVMGQLRRTAVLKAPQEFRGR